MKALKLYNSFNGINLTAATSLLPRPISYAATVAPFVDSFLLVGGESVAGTGNQVKEISYPNGFDKTSFPFSEIDLQVR